MNLSFSTRGWQSLSWDELIETADEMRFSGIELYNIQKCPELTEKGCPLHKYNTAATVRMLRERGIKIPCLDTSFDISAEKNIDTLKELIDIAHNLKVPYVCAVALNDNEELVKATVAELIAYAEAVDVTVLLKTSGIYSDTARLRALLDEFASDNLAALWDMHHPYRTNGESADKTIRNLGAYVKHVHLRDSDDEDTYNLIGEGNMPIAEMMRALSSIDYNGFISLEWKPEWMEDLQEYEVIFPHFVNYMN
ncbi:MAG: sugar phosphate isomerase/epimerase, partial [Oscillospiraceae bacterium]|nr:sugar phosphate isomerase/epimerase [Oscillospiraceae bacterium]